MGTATTPTRLLTSGQAAKALGISLDRLKALRLSSDGPEWGRFVGTIRYTSEELNNWQHNRSATQTSSDD